MKVVDKLKTALRTYNVEPIVFFYMIGYNLSSVCFLKLIQDKVCRHEFQLDHDFCANIHIAQYAQSQDAIKVFGRATYLNLISTVTTAFPTFASVMFVGPW